MGAGPDALEETLGRLSKKPGVKATIVLDRTTGAVLKTNGHVASFRKANSNPLGLSSSLPGQTTGSFSSNDGQSTGFETNGIEEMAAAVWGFIQATDGLVHDLDTEDELKLLRLRTKKQELVIVPDAKYLLIVVHDTPPA